MNIQAIVNGAIKKASDAGKEIVEQAEEKAVKPGKEALKQVEKEGKKAKKKALKAEKKALKKGKKKAAKGKKKAEKSAESAMSVLDGTGSEIEKSTRKASKNAGELATKPVQVVASALDGVVHNVKEGKIPLGINLDDFLTKIKSLIGRVPFSKDAIAMYFCMKDSKTPAYAKGVIAAALAYLLLPNDAIPEWVAGLGFTDDAVVMATALAAVRAHVTDTHWEKAEELLNA